MSTPIIKIKDLKKYYKVLNRQEGLLGALKDLFSNDYRIIKAVDGINFEVNKGEIIGFLGPNGAGKSTTIKMMTGILKSSQGHIDVNGFEPHDQRQKYVADIGTVFGQRTQLWWDIPVVESFKILKEIYKLSDEDYDRNINFFEDLIGIKKFFSSTVRSLSLGQRMLCDIAAAFLHNPSVIFLDEPSIGLDVAIKQKIRFLIKQLNERYQTTVILTSHDMGDVESLCQRVVLIDSGKIIYDGQTEKFNQIFGSFRTLLVNLDETVNELMIQSIKEVWNQYEETEMFIDGLNLKITFKQENIPLIKVLEILQNKIKFSDFKVQELDMETVITRVYDGALK
ncbi:ABC transporter ATP-binding protein [Marinicellulosiphila megalodicopiae]|uniref:ABC transporter ATP-binding protein n=1 Tax=Marinicellulosiphila megalodicopiae TaxID=2724896 RepID=UPI003BAE54D8